MKQSAQYKVQNYEISDFNANMSLKIGFNNIVLIFFLLSPILLTVVCLTVGKSGSGLLLALYGSKHNMSLSLFSVIPSLLFCINQLFMSEAPKGVVKKIWKKGPVLFRASAVLNLGLALYIAFVGVRHASAEQLVLCLLGAISVYYSFFSKRLYDYFLFFPKTKLKP